MQTYSLWQMVQYMTKLGTIGFGGPVALVGYMQRDLVEQRKWISESDFKEGLTLAQLMPGPLAAQLAIYLGYVHYGITGATAAGVAFVLPSFIMVVALGAAYVAYGGLVWLVRAPPKRWLPKGGNAPLLALPALGDHLPTACALGATADWSVLAQIGVFFAEAGAFVFGSGLAIVPFLYGGVVNEHHWLTERQFVDAVAVAMITPGPVVITVGFIGYLVAGLAGAVVAALGTFLPCYLFTIIPAPYFRKHGKKPAIVAFVDGCTAAAIGTITGAVVVLGKRSITDIPTIAILAVTLLLLWKAKKIPEPAIVALAVVAGLIVYPLIKG